jgi:NAD-dependent dihydropyrimidine dehydrogenase PreA subunit
MSRIWYPIIDYDICSRCGACANKCRRGVYKLEGGKPIVIYRRAAYRAATDAGISVRRARSDTQMTVRGGRPPASGLR